MVVQEWDEVECSKRTRPASCRNCKLFRDRNGMEGKNVDSHRLYSVLVARDWRLKVNSREDWGDIIEKMALPQRCMNNEFALKKINVWFLDKYEKVNFHGELTDPTKRRTTSGIIGGGQRRCCTVAGGLQHR
ncbi:AT-rich interactive domain-containing protein 2-like [Culex quinquefasciatus]|uniref:AT-rich interactive domain-containing protein 2-like n=1 Tax=Culex quinquefasciatus TaxID=7176 RepID=UPI0018E30B6F|nr:AT-rich interactive domain-containing protein 2-like [Culex quinquefasciatus]XP_038118345.1 AT-rich interactive domain-containing protein 2-like [Culex quinquefasciatus]